MKNRALTNGGIHAYIIPSADAHQVTMETHVCSDQISLSMYMSSETV